jgi:type IV pilus assembly protein PilB
MLVRCHNLGHPICILNPLKNSTGIRFRADGEIGKTQPPLAIKDKLSSRIKVISKLDISEKEYLRMAG